MTSHEFGNNLKKLTRKLKNEDSKYATIAKVIQVFYLIIILVFAISTIWEFSNSHDINDIISGAGLIMGFFIFAITFRKYYEEYKYVDYSLPTLEMLKKAASRYEPFQKKVLWVLLGVVFIDMGLTFQWLDHNMSVLQTQIVFIGAIFLGVIIGLINWYFNYKPLLDNVNELIDEILE